MVDLLFASHNQGKAQEVKTLLSSLPLKILLPTDVQISDDFEVSETGQTFAANAELKAGGFAGQLQDAEETQDIWILAEDSGLSVDNLNGEPGVYSKRYAPGSDHDRNQFLLSKLVDFRQPSQRTAHFVTVFCLYQPEQNQTHFFEGQVQGRIALTEKGAAGFGYDSIFIPEGSQKTFGELGVEFKNTVSHRARAAEHLCTFLAKELHE